MVNLIRKPGRRIDLVGEIKKMAERKKREKELKEKFEELKKSAEKFRKIKTTPKDMQNIKRLWREIEKIEIADLGNEELLRIINSERKFVNDFLKGYSKK